MNPKTATTRHIIIKVSKVKGENLKKTVREKQLVAYKGTSIRLPADFQQKFCRP